METKSKLSTTEIARGAIIECATRLASNDQKSQFYGLFSGLAGQLLFFWKLYQYDSELVDEAVFAEKFEELQNSLVDSVSDVGVGNGLSGIAWFLEYVNQSQSDDYDQEANSEIDSLLLERLKTKNWIGEIEALAGLGGAAIYSARRQRKADQAPQFKELIRLYDALSEPQSETTIAWPQPKDSMFLFDRESSNNKEYNLGLAHGNLGIIAALLPALKTPVTSLKTRRMLVQSCDWLIQQAHTNTQGLSLYPYSAGFIQDSRLAWCYGDATIALTLARAGKALDKPNYLKEANRVARHSARRRLQSSMVVDAGVCHGSAGLFLIFYLLNKEMPCPELDNASRYWLHITLERYLKTGLEGFYEYSTTEQQYQESFGLLGGYAGIGLCLLVALGQEPDWADCLLLS